MTEIRAAGPTSAARAAPTAGEESDVPSASEADLASLKALAHPVRLRMVEMLARGGGELCVCHFEEEFDLTQPTVSHHLKRLREAGLVASRKEGTWVHQRIRPEGMARVAEVLGAWAGTAGGARGG